MVTFNLVYRDDKFIRYEYYPEDERDKKPGIITIDIGTGKTSLTEPAEEDRLIINTKEEQNLLTV